MNPLVIGGAGLAALCLLAKSGKSDKSSGDAELMAAIDNVSNETAYTRNFTRRELESLIMEGSTELGAELQAQMFKIDGFLVNTTFAKVNGWTWHLATWAGSTGRSDGDIGSGLSYHPATAHFVIQYHHHFVLQPAYPVIIKDERTAVQQFNPIVYSPDVFFGLVMTEENLFWPLVLDTWKKAGTNILVVVGQRLLLIYNNVQRAFTTLFVGEGVEFLFKNGLEHPLGFVFIRADGTQTPGFLDESKDKILQDIYDKPQYKILFSNIPWGSVMLVAAAAALTVVTAGAAGGTLAAAVGTLSTGTLIRTGLSTLASKSDSIPGASAFGDAIAGYDSLGSKDKKDLDSVVGDILKSRGLLT